MGLALHTPIHVHEHTHARTEEGPFLALILCCRKNRGCTLSVKHSFRFTSLVGWTGSAPSGHSRRGRKRQGRSGVCCLRGTTPRPPAAEELSGTVSADNRPTLLSLSSLGPGAGGSQDPSMFCLGLLEAFRTPPPPAPALSRGGSQHQRLHEGPLGSHSEGWHSFPHAFPESSLSLTRATSVSFPLVYHFPCSLASSLPPGQHPVEDPL